MVGQPEAYLVLTCAGYVGKTDRLKPGLFTSPGSMPLAFMADAAAELVRNLISAAAPCGIMRARRNAAYRYDLRLKFGWNRADQINPRKKLDLGDQRENYLRLAFGDIHLRTARLRAEQQFGFYGLRNSQAREHVIGVHGACPRWVEADGFCVHQRAPQRFRCADVGFRGSRANAHSNSGAGNFGAASPGNFPLLDQIVQNFRGQDRGVKCFPGLNFVSQIFRGVRIGGRACGR